MFVWGFREPSGFKAPLGLVRVIIGLTILIIVQSVAAAVVDIRNGWPAWLCFGPAVAPIVPKV